MSRTEELALAVRRHVLNMTHSSKASHVGSCLSVADILAVLYGAVVRHDPKDPADPLRDRVIISKGHAAAAVYAVLAECGYFPSTELSRFYLDGSTLSGHVSHLVDGVELSTGALGHGLSVGAGMALNSRGEAGSFRTFVVLSDGECDEGSVWEAAMFAGHHKLSKLTAIIDYNKLQSLASTAATLELEPFADKWASFGWRVDEVDGHSHSALSASMRAQGATSEDRPHCLIAHTTKGKGVPFMENSVLWHYRSPSVEDLHAALSSLPQNAST